MTGIHIENFAGIAPKYSEKKLADNLATKAENVRLESSSIEAYKAPLAIGESVGASDLSAYPYLLIWLTSAFRRQYVDSLVPHDVRESLFYNDADYPKIRTGGAEYRLGLPRPAAPTSTITNGGDTSDLTFIRLQSYKVTFVDIWGYEGPPSDASIAVEVGQGSTVNVDLPATPSASYALDKIRLYRSNTGSNTTYFQFVTEVAIGTGDYDDSIPSEYLQESIPSDEWIGPPDDDLATYPQGPLASLVELPGGVMAGHSGNSVYFSEPYVPTAWPERYRVTRDRQVVALCPVSGGLFVATNKQPYLIAGTQPGSMVAVPIESNQACVSQASMVNMGDYCIYASPDGLVMGQGNAAKLLTDQWLSPREWQAQFNPTTIRAFPYEGKYLAFFGDALDGTGFVFDPSEGLQGLFTLQGVKVQGGHWEAKTDRLYLLHTTDEVNWELGEFNEGSDLTWTWHSKDFKAPLDLNMVCYRIEAESYPISLEIWADGVQKAVIAVPDSATHRLPRGFKARRWQIRVSGTGRLDSVGIWDSMSEVS